MSTAWRMDSEQFARIDLHLGAIANALWEINDKLKPLDNAIDKNTTEVTKWLGLTVEAINNIQPLPQPQPRLLEIKFMYIVKNDNPDVPFSIVLGDVTDSEGNTIPDAEVSLNVLSTDEDVVAVTFDPATKSGSVHFGNAGTATVTATVSSGENLLGTGAADFTVTLGDPAAISSVSLSFEGLSEA